MKKIVSMILISILAVVLISGCSDGEIKEDQGNQNQEDINKETNMDENEDESQGAEEEQEEETKIKAPDFTLLDREGNEITLSDLKGKVIFLNFWNSWCDPCKIEMPDIQKTYEKYKDNDEVMVLTINITAGEKNGVKDTNAFIEENDYTFPVLLDIKGEVARKYYVRGIPTSFFIDKEGYIYDFITGPMNEERMIKYIEEAPEK